MTLSHISEDEEEMSLTTLNNTELVYLNGVKKKMSMELGDLTKKAELPKSHDHYTKKHAPIVDEEHVMHSQPLKNKNKLLSFTNIPVCVIIDEESETSQSLVSNPSIDKTMEFIPFVGMTSTKPQDGCYTIFNGSSQNAKTVSNLSAAKKGSNK